MGAPTSPKPFNDLTKRPTPSPTQQPASDSRGQLPVVLPGQEAECSDVEDWYDSNGELFDCSWYADESMLDIFPDGKCATFGNGSRNFGRTANEACCVCGGGDINSAAPTKLPTAAPTSPKPFNDLTKRPTPSPTQQPASDSRGQLPVVLPGQEAECSDVED